MILFLWWNLFPPTNVRVFLRAVPLGEFVSKTAFKMCSKNEQDFIKWKGGGA